VQSSNAGGQDAFVAMITPSVIAPTITSISTDSGSSSSDFITTDQTLSISGTANASATITLSRSDVGVLGTTTSDGSGNFTYDYTGTTLADGVYAFTATGTVSGVTSPPSVEKLITVDLTAPTVALTVAPTTFDTAPEVRVTSSDLVGLPANATVTLDVDLNNDGDFLDAGESGYATSHLSNGFADFQVSPALSLGTVKMRARESQFSMRVDTNNFLCCLFCHCWSHRWSNTGVCLRWDSLLRQSRGIDGSPSRSSGTSPPPAT
jgi:hypothetical protein